MPLLDALTQEITAYNRRFQELTARIYEDGYVSCQEATDGTAYYQSVRPRIKRLHKFTRRWIQVIYHRYSARLFLTGADDRRHRLIASGNDRLRAYHQAMHEIEKLLNDSRVMLKIFADVLRDCDDK